MTTEPPKEFPVYGGPHDGLQFEGGLVGQRTRVRDLDGDHLYEFDGKEWRYKGFSSIL